VRVIFAVPYRSDDGGRRDRIWDWVRNRLEELHSDWPIFVGEHTDGEFNRSAAINTAARDGGDWDVMVISDADSFVDGDQLRRAVDLCHQHEQVTFAYDRFAYLNKRMSDLVLNGFTDNWWPGVEWTMTNTCSSMVCVPRKPWDESGGADEGFVGWGGEDIAISHMLQTFGNGMKRVNGEVWHLWHPTAARGHPDAWSKRIDRYARASYDRTKMKRLISNLRREDAEKAAR
jgi:hypothetical protein